MAGFMISISSVRRNPGCRIRFHRNCHHVRKRVDGFHTSSNCLWSACKEKEDCTLAIIGEISRQFGKRSSEAAEMTPKPPLLGLQSAGLAALGSGMVLWGSCDPRCGLIGGNIRYSFNINLSTAAVQTVGIWEHVFFSIANSSYRFRPTSFELSKIPPAWFDLICKPRATLVARKWRGEIGNVT
jgi:hypothetical protein